MLNLQRYSWIVLCGWIGGGIGAGALRAGPAEEDKVVLTADGPVRINYEKEQATARDNVEVRYRDIVLHGDRLQADFKSGEARLEGNVTATTRGQTITCDALRFNLKTRDYALENGKLTLTPDFVGGGVIEPLFIEGVAVEAKGQEEIRVLRPSITSCEREEPHYLLSAKRVALYPERKMILWDGSLSVLGRRVVSLPKLEIPLRNLRRGLPFTPEFGRNDVEGYYLKTHYQLPTASLNAATGVQVDLTEKQGTRLGVEHQYRTERQRQGWIDVDYAMQEKSLSARVNHQEQVSREFNADLGLDYNERNPFASGQRQLNANLRLMHHNQQGSSSTLSLRQQSTFSRQQQPNGDVRTNLNDTLAVNLTQRSLLGRSQKDSQGVQAYLNADYYRRYYRRHYRPQTPDLGTEEETEEETDEELNTRLEVLGQAPNFRWTLQDERRFDLDGDAYQGDNFYSFTETVPHLTLMSDARQLKWGLPRNVYSTMQFDVGRFREVQRRDNNPFEVDVFRTYFETDLRASSIPLSQSVFLNSNLGFEQSFFSDETAKYNLRSNTSLTAGLGGGWDLQTSHFYQRSFGYSPLSRFDFTGRSDRLTTSLNFSEDRQAWKSGGYGGYGGYETYGDYGGYGGGGYYEDEGDYRSRAAGETSRAAGYETYEDYGYRRVRPRRQPWRIGFNSGYDLLRSRWNTMGINASGSLSPSSWMSLNTRYDFAGQGFSDVSVQMNYAGSHLALDTSLLYSPQQKTKLSAVRSFVSWRAARKVRLETLLEYRGQERKFTYNDVLLTYDLHCWEAVLVYNKQLGGFRLDFNLKAYPRSDFGFGVGRFGQGFDTSLGGYY